MSKKKSDNTTNIVYVFIDASNLWEAQKIKGKFFDYEKLKKVLKEKYNAEKIEFFYYSAYPAERTRDYSLDGKHKFFTFLSKGLGFNVRKKELKRITVLTDEGQTIEEKGDLDVEVTIDALHHIEKYNVALLFSGDSDFLPLVSYLRKRDKEVYIYSSKNNISEELRTGGDGYQDVLDMKEDMGKGVEASLADTIKINNPPQGGLFLDVVPFQFMAQLKDTYSISVLERMSIVDCG